MPALFGLLFFSFFYDKAILSLVLPAFFPIPAACSLVLTSLASCILKTPMEAYDPRGKDFLVWLHSKSGLLTSKSAYIAIHSQENAASTSSSEENIQTFAKLWKVKRFSPRVIVFMWRCLSEAIPTDVRRSRHISSIDYSCPICHYVMKIGKQLSISSLGATWPGLFGLARILVGDQVDRILAFQKL